MGAAALIREYIESPPRPSRAGENAKRTCLQDRLAAMGDEAMREAALRLGWGVDVYGTCSRHFLAGMIVRRSFSARRKHWGSRLPRH